MKGYCIEKNHINLHDIFILDGGIKRCWRLVRIKGDYKLVHISEKDHLFRIADAQLLIYILLYGA